MDTPCARPFTIVVGIATSGRREVLRDTLARIDRQERLPQRVLICPAADSDVDWEHAAGLSVPVERVDGPKGLTSQRNAILDAAGDPDLIVFFDDDFLPADRFLAEAEQLFLRDLEIVAATGEILADGVRGPGIDLAAGLAVLAEDRAPAQARALPIDDLYGCNMVFRFATIAQAGLRFDENLPLYGWHEDIDFSGQLRGRGRIVLSTALRGVHRGVKRGRTSGLRFGYSQIANPIYVSRKGTVAWPRSVRFLVGNVAANLLGSLRPQGLIDRRGRLKGNLIALWDLVRGRLAPQRILTLG